MIPKRIISTLLSVCTLIMLLPVIALPVSAEVRTGECGTAVTYTWDTDAGVLTISGTGAMKDYSAGETPWYYKDDNTIKTIIIEDGVTSIGDYAFYECFAATSVTIPDSVISIGEGAFEHCRMLTDITIPDGVTSIGEAAFNICTELTSITIPDSVTSIGRSAFSNCEELTSITIPDGVTLIEDFVFNSCYNLVSVTLPDGLTSIGSAAFGHCYALSGLTIPASVNSIEDEAFGYCKALSSITIPDGVASIGNGAFSHSNILSSITVPASVTSIGSNAFSGINANAVIDFGGDCSVWASFANLGYADTVTVNYGSHSGAAWSSDDTQHWYDACVCGAQAGPLGQANHTWDSGVITTAPTETTEGVKTYTCTACGHTKTESVDKLPVYVPTPTYPVNKVPNTIVFPAFPPEDVSSGAGAYAEAELI